LQEIGEYENTIIVFVSDHGDMMGAHGLLEKGHLLHYDEALRVPLIISARECCLYSFLTGTIIRRYSYDDADHGGAYPLQNEPAI